MLVMRIDLYCIAFVSIYDLNALMFILIACYYVSVQFPVVFYVSTHMSMHACINYVVPCFIFV